MANSTDKKERDEVKKLRKPLTKLNSLFSDAINNISFNVFKSDNKREDELKRISDEIDDIVYNEIKSLSNFTGEDISTFLVKLFNEYDDKKMTNVKTMEDIFGNDNASGMFDFFYNRYKNTNYMYDDLSVIFDQLYELQEAIYTIRDAIVSADDISNAMSRVIKFESAKIAGDSNSSYISIVENLENKFKLKSKLKNHIIPSGLQYGKYYAYTVPYAKLFEDFYRKKQKKSLNQPMLESITLESVDEKVIKQFKSDVGALNNDKDLRKLFDNFSSGIEVYNDDPFIPVIESPSDIEALADTDKFQGIVGTKLKELEKQQNKSAKTMFADGTADIKDKEADFSAIKECYIKLIDPRKLIPIKILDQVLGYYYIHEGELETSKTPFTTQIKLTQNGDGSMNVEQEFLSKITDKIVKAFDKKYLEENKNFKELILNALMYNDMYKKKVKFQFIPVDYITEFNVNTDVNDEGRSVIYPSLFYAKLYLAILLFTIYAIVSKSNDTKVYYVKQSGIDKNVTNKIQDLARSVKSKQINFMDLMNYNSLVSKIGANKDIFMPIGRSGDRGIEFDVIGGQDVQLNTDLRDMLRTAYISSTGVPAVIMNYINEADYAKTLVMANSKFAARVISYQMDFNESITELYKKILRFSTDIPEEIIQTFKFSFNAPKTVNNMNLNDILTNVDQAMNVMIKAKYGDNAPSDDTTNKCKDLLYAELLKMYAPMLPWATFDEIDKKVRMDATQKVLDDKITAGSGATT